MSLLGVFFECENDRNGKFSIFYPFPKCKADLVCFLPPKKKPEEINSSCIYISGKQYCKAEFNGVLMFVDMVMMNTILKPMLKKLKNILKTLNMKESNQLQLLSVQFLVKQLQ